MQTSPELDPMVVTIGEERAGKQRTRSVFGEDGVIGYEPLVNDDGEAVREPSGMKIFFYADGTVTLEEHVHPSTFINRVRYDLDIDDVTAKLLEGLAYSNVDLLPLSPYMENGDFAPEEAQIIATLFQAVFPVYHALFNNQELNDGFYGMFPCNHERFNRVVLQRNLRDFITTAFGCYRKDLVRILTSGQLSAEEFSLTLLFTGHIPVDWIITHLQGAMKHEGIDTYPLVVDTKQWEIFLTFFSIYDIRRFMSDENLVYLGDTVEMFYEIIDNEGILPDLPRRPSIIDIHDSMAEESADDFQALLERKGITSEYEFPIPGIFEDDTWCLIGEASPQVLRTPREYLEMGETMQNCVGSAGFINRAYDGRGAVVFWGGEEPEQNILAEFAKVDSSYTEQWRLTQIYHPDNRPIADEIRAHVLTTLSDMNTSTEEAQFLESMRKEQQKEGDEELTFEQFTVGLEHAIQVFKALEPHFID
jgi:hypothetical protein